MTSSGLMRDMSRGVGRFWSNEVGLSLDNGPAGIATTGGENPDHLEPHPARAARHIAQPRPGRLHVTAYCLTGTMANGRRAHAGAAAGNRWPLGTVLEVQGVGTVMVEDRIGHGSDLDLAMPGRCAEALAFGSRYLVVSRV